MPKLNAYVIISGNLIEDKEVLDWLKKLTSEYRVTVCPGGGEQINQAFKDRGWEKKFGPMGRICDTHEQRKVCEKILKYNQANIRHRFAKKGINAEVKIPLEYDENVLCLINNDHMVSRVYNGYDRIFRLTTKERKARKEAFFKRLTEICQEIGKGELDKLEILGF